MVNQTSGFLLFLYRSLMTPANLIPRIGERIEKLDTAIFSGPGNAWRYPSCIIHHIKMDPSGKSLWFRMKNIAFLDETRKTTPAFLFCYNKEIDFYVTVEGTASIAGRVEDPKAPDGWQDPLLSAQRTYLIRMDILHATSFYRSAREIPTPLSAPEVAANVKAGLLPGQSPSPSLSVKEFPKFGWPSFLTGLF
jgi:hypothetical protein